MAKNDDLWRFTDGVKLIHTEEFGKPPEFPWNHEIVQDSNFEWNIDEILSGCNKNRQKYRWNVNFKTTWNLSWELGATMESLFNKRHSDEQIES